jgi:haloalkane dehalogenase
MTREVRAGLLAPYDSWEHRIAINGFVRDIPASEKHPTWQTLEQIEAALPQLSDRPCQFIWGMKDWCFRPICLDRLLDSFPSARVDHLADASHYVVEDAYERIVPILDRFLAGRSHDAHRSA